MGGNFLIASADVSSAAYINVFKSKKRRKENVQIYIKKTLEYRESVFRKYNAINSTFRYLISIV